MSEFAEYENQMLRDEIKRLRIDAERDAQRIGDLEYALNTIAHDCIPSSLEPDEYALVALRATSERKTG